jgi:branched-chain amino acid transport system ATP-binding protein
MSEPLLAGEAIAKRFGGLQVLQGVGFAVRAGEIHALIGPNGAGKTTLFNLVSGLLTPDAGAIRLDGRDITGAPAHAVCRLGVGRTFQSPRPFLPLSVEANVEVAARFASRPRSAARDALALAGLGDDRAVGVARLPPARRKLAELAMVLAQAPRVVLLDEILGGLTPAETADFVALLRRLRRELGITLFWIDHVMGAVMDTADRVTVLHHGVVIADGAPGAVAGDARVIEAYLGTAPSA